jgi:hypothetical protein
MSLEHEIDAEKQEKRIPKCEQCMDAILALKVITPKCPDLCREWNAAIEDAVNVLKQHQ